MPKSNSPTAKPSPLPHDPKRIADGLAIIKTLQSDYTPCFTDTLENYPYHAAALIVSGGPYGEVSPKLQLIINDLNHMIGVVEMVKMHIDERESEDSQE